MYCLVAQRQHHDAVVALAVPQQQGGGAVGVVHELEAGREHHPGVVVSVSGDEGVAAQIKNEISDQVGSARADTRGETSIKACGHRTNLMCVI